MRGLSGDKHVPCEILLKHCAAKETDLLNLCLIVLQNDIKIMHSQLQFSFKMYTNDPTILHNETMSL